MVEFAGTLDTVDETDAYTVALRRNKTSILDVFRTGEKTLDPDMALSGDDGTFRDDLDSCPGSNAQLTFRPQGDGCHDIVVGGTDGTIGDYRVRMQGNRHQNNVHDGTSLGSLDADGVGRQGRIKYDGDSDAFGIDANQ